MTDSRDAENDPVLLVINLLFERREREESGTLPVFWAWETEWTTGHLPT